MAAGFFAVFDDIAALLDDAAMMSKVAAKKTAGVLGDDLAVGAEQASGFASSREFPVLWAITKGSFRNKIIILPIAFILSAFASWAIVPILMLGGLYLAFEGAEKIFEFLGAQRVEAKEREEHSQEEILAIEKEKVKSAILTDFILSIEIVIIALGSVVEKPLAIQIIVVTFIAFLATIGVYGFVALLVRMDDVGFKLIEMAKGKDNLLKKLGSSLVVALPKVIKLLTIIGTLAMLLVAGGIYTHNIPALHEMLHFMPSLLAEVLVGLFLGVIVWSLEKLLVMMKRQI